MSHLRLVFDADRPTEFTTGLTALLKKQVLEARFSEAFKEVASQFDTHKRTYGRERLLLWEFTNEPHGFFVRFILDVNGSNAGRQGIHTEFTTAFDSARIMELIDEAEKDGFDTVWIS